MSDMNIAGFGVGNGDDKDSDEGGSSKKDKVSGPIDYELVSQRRAKFQKIALILIVLFAVSEVIKQAPWRGSGETVKAAPPKQVGPQKVVPLWYNG